MNKSVGIELVWASYVVLLLVFWSALGNGAKQLVPDADDSDDEGSSNSRSAANMFNFASHTAGAVILDKSPITAKGFNNLLNDDKDKYGISSIEEKKKWIVIGLSEDIVITSIILANYEKYSSLTKDFQVLASTVYPTDHWFDLGTYTAEPQQGEQLFNITEPSSEHTRYLKIKFLTHHFDESLWTLSQVKVHGMTVIASFQQEVERSDTMLRDVLHSLNSEEDESEQVHEQNLHLDSSASEAQQESSGDVSASSKSTEQMSENARDNKKGEEDTASTSSEETATETDRPEASFCSVDALKHWSVLLEQIVFASRWIEQCEPTGGSSTCSTTGQRAAGSGSSSSSLNGERMNDVSSQACSESAATGADTSSTEGFIAEGMQGDNSAFLLAASIDPAVVDEQNEQSEPKEVREKDAVEVVSKTSKIDIAADSVHKTSSSSSLPVSVVISTSASIETVVPLPTAPADGESKSADEDEQQNPFPNDGRSAIVTTGMVEEGSENLKKQKQKQTADVGRIIMQEENIADILKDGAARGDVVTRSRTDADTPGVAAAAATASNGKMIAIDGDGTFCGPIGDAVDAVGGSVCDHNRANDVVSSDSVLDQNKRIELKKGLPLESGVISDTTTRSSTTSSETSFFNSIIDNTDSKSDVDSRMGISDDLHSSFTASRSTDSDNQLEDNQPSEQDELPEKAEGSLLHGDEKPMPKRESIVQDPFERRGSSETLREDMSIRIEDSRNGQAAAPSIAPDIDPSHSHSQSPPGSLSPAVASSPSGMCSNLSANGDGTEQLEPEPVDGRGGGGVGGVGSKVMDSGGIADCATISASVPNTARAATSKIDIAVTSEGATESASADTIKNDAENNNSNSTSGSSNSSNSSGTAASTFPLLPRLHETILSTISEGLIQSATIFNAGWDMTSVMLSIGAANDTLAAANASATATPGSMEPAGPALEPSVSTSKDAESVEKDTGVTLIDRTHGVSSKKEKERDREIGSNSDVGSAMAEDAEVASCNAATDITATTVSTTATTTSTATATISASASVPTSLPSSIDGEVCTGIQQSPSPSAPTPSRVPSAASAAPASTAAEFQRGITEEATTTKEAPNIESSNSFDGSSSSGVGSSNTGNSTRSRDSNGDSSSATAGECSAAGRCEFSPEATGFLPGAKNDSGDEVVAKPVIINGSFSSDLSTDWDINTEIVGTLSADGAGGPAVQQQAMTGANTSSLLEAVLRAEAVGSVGNTGVGTGTGGGAANGVTIVSAGIRAGSGSGPGSGSVSKLGTAVGSNVDEGAVPSVDAEPSRAVAPAPVPQSCLETLKFADFHARMLAKLQKNSAFQPVDGVGPAGGGGGATGSSGMGAGAAGNLGGPAAGFGPSSAETNNVFRVLMQKIKTMEMNSAIVEMFTEQLTDCYRQTARDLQASQQSLQEQLFLARSSTPTERVTAGATDTGASTTSATVQTESSADVSGVGFTDSGEQRNDASTTNSGISGELGKGSTDTAARGAEAAGSITEASSYEHGGVSGSVSSADPTAKEAFAGSRTATAGEGSAAAVSEGVADARAEEEAGDTDTAVADAETKVVAADLAPSFEVAETVTISREISVRVSHQEREVEAPTVSFEDDDLRESNGGRKVDQASREARERLGNDLIETDNALNGNSPSYQLQKEKEKQEQEQAQEHAQAGRSISRNPYPDGQRRVGSAARHPGRKQHCRRASTSACPTRTTIEDASTSNDDHIQRLSASRANNTDFLGEELGISVTELTDLLLACTQDLFDTYAIRVVQKLFFSSGNFGIVSTDSTSYDNIVGGGSVDTVIGIDSRSNKPACAIHRTSTAAIVDASADAAAAGTADSDALQNDTARRRDTCVLLQLAAVDWLERHWLLALAVCGAVACASLCMSMILLCCMLFPSRSSRLYSFSTPRGRVSSDGLSSNREKRTKSSSRNSRGSSGDLDKTDYSNGSSPDAAAVRAVAVDNKAAEDGIAAIAGASAAAAGVRNRRTSTDSGCSDLRGRRGSNGSRSNRGNSGGCSGRRGSWGSSGGIPAWREDEAEEEGEVEAETSDDSQESVEGSPPRGPTSRTTTRSSSSSSSTQAPLSPSMESDLFFTRSLGSSPAHSATIHSPQSLLATGSRDDESDEERDSESERESDGNNEDLRAGIGARTTVAGVYEDVETTIKAEQLGRGGSAADSSGTCSAVSRNGSTTNDSLGSSSSNVIPGTHLIDAQNICCISDSINESDPAAGSNKNNKKSSRRGSGKVRVRRSSSSISSSSHGQGLQGCFQSTTRSPPQLPPLFSPAQNTVKS